MLTPLPELTALIEHRFSSIGEATDDDLAVTGQPYVDLVVDVGTRDNAVDAGLKMFEQYATRRMGTLYWRQRPALERVRIARRTAYRVRMKLLISDNPVVQRIAAEALRDRA